MWHVGLSCPEKGWDWQSCDVCTRAALYEESRKLLVHSNDQDSLVHNWLRQQTIKATWCSLCTQGSPSWIRKARKSAQMRLPCTNSVLAMNSQNNRELPSMCVPGCPVWNSLLLVGWCTRYHICLALTITDLPKPSSIQSTWSHIFRIGREIYFIIPIGTNTESQTKWETEEYGSNEGT